MTRPGPAHPLDVDLADLADGALAAPRAAALDAHLEGCLLCRLKLARLRHAPPGPGPAPTTFPLVAPLPLPPLDADADPAPGDLWLAGEDDRLLVAVLRLHHDRALLAPVTLDVESADDETVVVDAGHSPLGTGLAVHPALATELPRSVLAARLGTGLPLDRTADAPSAGPPVTGPADPRLDLRHELAARLAGLEDVPPDPSTAADAPRPGADQVRSTLIADLRAMRGDVLLARALDGWQGVTLAARRGWVPLALLDEVGIVLVVFDTPAGLSEPEEFDAARSVLTRFNATALVVLASAVSDLADVYDAPALSAGIDLPTGVHAPPRPLVSGLSPFDAVAKYLDQHTGARSMGLPSRGGVGRVDVADVLRSEAAAAVADLARQGARFKIAPKRRGYESVASEPGALAEALSAAFSEDGADGDDGPLVVERLLDLIRRPHP
ncbi:MAG: hypothetical protein ACLGI2_13550 [Acidimicrobiia bacterium]